MLEKQVAQTCPQRIDAHVVSGEVLPFALTKECPLRFVPLSKGTVAIFEPAIFYDVPAEREEDILILGKTNECCFVLRTWMKLIRLCNDTKRSAPLWVNIPGPA